jgi:hypothetical protein
VFLLLLMQKATMTAIEFVSALMEDQIPSARDLMVHTLAEAAVVPIGDALARAGIVNSFEQCAMGGVAGPGD